MALSTLAKTLLWIIGALLLYMVYQLIMLLFKSNVYIVTKSNKLRRVKQFPKNGRFIVDGGTYPIDSNAVIPSEGKLFWQSNYLFDEDSTKPRVLKHKKDDWLGAGAITKIINDEHIKAMASKILEPKDRAMIYLAALASTAALISSGVLLAMELGLIK